MLTHSQMKIIEVEDFRARTVKAVEAHHWFYLFTVLGRFVYSGFLFVRCSVIVWLRKHFMKGYGLFTAHIPLTIHCLINKH